MWDTPNNGVDNQPFHHREVDNLSIFQLLSTVVAYSRSVSKSKSISGQNILECEYSIIQALHRKKRKLPTSASATTSPERWKASSNF